MRRKYDYATRLEDAPDWLKAELRSTRLNNSMRLLAAHYVAGTHINDYVLRKVGLVYRKDEKIPEATIKVLLKQPLVQQLLDRKILEALGCTSVTADDVITGYQQAYQVAKKKSDAGGMIRATDRLWNLVMMSERAKESKRLDYTVDPDFDYDAEDW